MREPSLERFVGGVIQEEFQGAPLAPQALAALVAYLRALDPGTCADSAAPITLAAAADDVRRALAATETMAPPMASLLLLSAQDGVGRIVETGMKQDWSWGHSARRYSELYARIVRKTRQAVTV